MLNPEPQRLIIKYNDGSTREVEFGKLSKVVQFELSKLRDSLVPSSLLVPRKYLLLSWKDGWQEVMRIEEDCVDLLRYYVIQRIEEAGRLAIVRSGPYPELIIIGRRPRELRKVGLTDGKDTKTYTLAEESAVREGVKTEHRYELNKVDGDFMEEIMRQLKKALRNDGTRAKELLDRSDAQKIEEYERIRKEIGLRATEKEEDALAFIQMMLEILAKNEEK